jgi:tetratricopeptide (TPR) repeat protein
MKKIILPFFLFFFYTLCSAQVDSVLVKLQKQIKQSKTKSERIKPLFTASKHCLNVDLTLAEKYMNEARDLISSDDIKNLSIFYQQSAILNRKKGNYPEAIKFDLSAISLCEKLKDTTGTSKGLISLGVTSRFRDDNNQAIKYFKKSIALSTIRKDTFLIGQGCNMMGVAFRRLKKLDSAMIYYNRAMKMFSSIKNKGRIVSVNNNIAILYSSQGKYEKSVSLILKNLGHSKKVNNTMSIAIGYYNIGNGYYKNGEYEKALKYIDSSYNLSKQLGFKFRLAQAVKVKSKIKVAKGDFKSAFEYNNRYHSLSNSIFNIESEKKLREFELQREFDLERKELELNSEIEEAKNKLYFLLLISLLISGSFVSYLMKRNYKGKIKYVAAQLEKEKLKKELLDERIKVSEVELKWLIADSTTRLSYLKEFTSQLKSFQKESNETNTKNYINRLLIHLQQQIFTVKKLSSIQSKIKEVNRGFEAIIIEKFPTLTKSEREVCMLSRVNLSIKEMASIRNTTIDSVKSTRYRLRKKLNIPKEIELENFIRSL